MSDATYQRLKEASWRRELTPAERSQLEGCLKADPRRQAEWEEEARLTLALGQLPDTPLSSNFTALVRQRVEREIAFIERQQRRRSWRPWLRWARAAIVASLLLGAGFLAFQQHQARARADMARSLAEVSTVANLPTEWLQDFEAIHRLNQMPLADDELLVALLE